MACSGTIETPTEEFPPRQGGTSQAATDDDDSPRAPAAPSNTNNDDDDPPPAASNNDDDPPVAPPADDETDPPADDPPADDPPAAGALSFEADIQPIFNTTCGPCHAGQATAGVDIGNDDIEVALEDARNFEDRVLSRIEMGGMPPSCLGGAPGDSGCITEDDLADVEAWYAAGAPE